MPDFQPIKKAPKAQKTKSSFVKSMIPCRDDPPSEIVRKFVFLIAILILVSAVAIIIYFYVVRDAEINREYEQLEGLHDKSHIGDVISIHMPIVDNDGNSTDQTEEVEVLQEYLDYYNTNNDFVGYIQMSSWIRSPVVQAADNEFYLKHNFYQQVTENGTIFADYEGPITATSVPHNIILYGHNLITRNSFQPLSEFRSQGISFLKDNYILNFDTLYEKNQYIIFAVMLTNTQQAHGEVFNYHTNVYFNSKSEFDGFVAECLDRSYFYTGIDMQYGDELLTLSTCDFSTGFEDMRMVVVARKVRDNENPILDTETFIDNTGRDENGYFKRKMFQAYYDAYGVQWGGRNWDPSYIKDFEGYDDY